MVIVQTNERNDELVKSANEKRTKNRGKCSVLHRNGFSSLQNVLHHKIVGLFSIFLSSKAWMCVRCRQNDVNISLSVCIYSWYALYRHSHRSDACCMHLSCQFSNSSLVLKCILTNTSLNGKHLVEKSSASRWIQYKCSLNMAHYNTTRAMWYRLLRMLPCRCGAFEKEFWKEFSFSHGFWWLSQMWKSTMGCNKKKCDMENCQSIHAMVTQIRE